MQYQDPQWQQQMKIRLDVSNMMRDVLGDRGIRREELEEPRFAMAAQQLRQKQGQLQLQFQELPNGQDEVVERILDVAQKVRAQFESFVVLGIGGSALGPIAVHQALKHLHYNELPAEKRGGPRFYVEDNVDPVRMQALLDVIDPATTCFNVITKSGKTSETMAQLLIVANLLKERGIPLKDNVIATTDCQSGNLIKIAKQEGLTTFFIPEGVGGRFTELCPVGLLAAAVCGIDIKALLAGAAFMQSRLQSDSVWENMAYLDGALQYICAQKGINVSVMMPYSDSLKYMADWYAQLWAESLGKQYDFDGNHVYVGQTPVKSLGVTDQHSQVQLYTEGPFDKVITFIGVDRYGAEVPIPHGFADTPDVAFLGGHTLNELIQAEQFATSYALNRAGRLNKTITLPEINEFTIGQLLYMLEQETAYMGELLRINAFDQPGVEEGKNATYALLGKNGFAQKKAEMDAAPKPKPEYQL